LLLAAQLLHPADACTLSFFFQRAAALRDLHSFPTRRSSDLALQAGRGREGVGPRVASFFHDAGAGREAGLELIRVDGHPHRGRKDRKSTRLNSSHDQISYAVFCLKKKTKNITEDICVSSQRL